MLPKLHSGHNFRALSISLLFTIGEINQQEESSHENLQHFAIGLWLTFVFGQPAAARTPTFIVDDAYAVLGSIVDHDITTQEVESEDVDILALQQGYALFIV